MNSLLFKMHLYLSGDAMVDVAETAIVVLRGVVLSHTPTEVHVGRRPKQASDWRSGLSTRIDIDFRVSKITAKHTAFCDVLRCAPDIKVTLSGAAHVCFSCMLIDSLHVTTFGTAICSGHGIVVRNVTIRTGRKSDVQGIAGTHTNDRKVRGTAPRDERPTAPRGRTIDAAAVARALGLDGDASDEAILAAARARK